MKRIDENSPFNAGWNACLSEVIERVKKLPTEVASDGICLLVAKYQILDLLRSTDD